MVNKTQIDFRRKPEDWGNALYTQLGQIINEINGNIADKIRDLEDRLQKAENKIVKLNTEKI